MAVLIHLFHPNRPSTRCAKLSSISTIPQKQCTFEMGFGEMAVLIHLYFIQIDLHHGVRNCPLFLAFHINTARLRWDLVKWWSSFTYFIQIDLQRVVRNCPRFPPFHTYNVRLRWDLVKWRSSFTCFIQIDLQRRVRNCPLLKLLSIVPY